MEDPPPDHLSPLATSPPSPLTFPPTPPLPTPPPSPPLPPRHPSQPPPLATSHTYQPPPPLPTQFGTSFAFGTLRIDDPLVCVRDNEPQPRPVARRGREGSSGGSSPLHAELDDVDPELRNALTADALAASPGSGPTAPAESVSAAAATTAAAAAAAAPAAAALAAADPLHRIPTHDRGVPLSLYERQRLANIAANRRVLEALSLV